MNPILKWNLPFKKKKKMAVTISVVAKKLAKKSFGPDLSNHFPAEYTGSVLFKMILKKSILQIVVVLSVKKED